MKYLFEMYEFGKKGQIFLGYKSIVASNNEEAKTIAEANLPEGVMLAQIYISQEL